MFLLVCMVNLNEAIGFALIVGKLNAEFLDDLFKMCDSVA